MVFFCGVKNGSSKEGRIEERREIDHGIRIERWLEELQPFGVVLRGVAADDDVLSVVVLAQFPVGEARRPQVDDQPDFN